MYFLYIYGVSSLETLVAKLFSCEMCYEQKRINFQSHLGRKKECLRKYRLKFGLKDIEKINAKVKALKRKAYPSRSPVAQKSKYERLRESKSLFKSLNEYRENTALGNYKLCIQCRANYREFGAKEVKKEKIEKCEEKYKTQKAVTHIITGNKKSEWEGCCQEVKGCIVMWQLCCGCVVEV